MVDGYEIGFTQHGLITSPEGWKIGTYKRIIDAGGEQQMLVFMN